MFYWKIFKNKYFWLFITIISLSAGIWSFLYDKKRDKLLEKSPLMYCVDNRSTSESRYVLVITDIDHAENYIAYYSGEMEKQNFRSIAIPNGSKVKAIDKKYDGRLIKAVLTHKTDKRITYEEFWVWHEFVIAEPPDSLNAE